MKNFMYLCSEYNKTVDMKRLTLLILAMVFVGLAKAEDGHQLWLRYQPVNTAKVTGPEFLSTSKEYAFDAFPLHSFDYLIKPYTIDKLNKRHCDCRL